MKFRAVPTRPQIAQCLEYPIGSFGGTEVLVGELIRGLSEEFEITLVSDDKTLEGSPFKDLVARHIPWDPRGVSRDRCQALARQLRDSGVEIAHFHCGNSFAWGNRRVGVAPMLWAKELGMRVLTTNHGFFSPLEGYCAFYRSLASKLALFPISWLAKLQQVSAGECEIAVSDYDLRGLQFWYAPVRAKFQRIYHSQISETAARGGLPERARQIICVGTFGYRKGQQFLAQAFLQIAARYPDWELVFAGRIGDQYIWDEVEQLAAAAGLTSRIRRIEGLSNAAIADLMRSSEIFVMPSLFEGLGLSLQEALFHGCACISSRSGGPTDLIDSEDNGLLVPKADAGALAQALERLMSDPDLRSRFRRRGSASILEKGMTVEAMVEQYRRLYRATT